MSLLNTKDQRLPSLLARAHHVRPTGPGLTLQREPFALHVLHRDGVGELARGILARRKQGLRTRSRLEANTALQTNQEL